MVRFGGDGDGYWSNGVAIDESDGAGDAALMVFIVSPQYAILMSAVYAAETAPVVLAVMAFHCPTKPSMHVVCVVATTPLVLVVTAF